MKSERTAMLLLVLLLLAGLGALTAYLRSDTNRALQFPTPPEEVIVALKQQAATEAETAQALRSQVAQLESQYGEANLALKETRSQLETQKGEVAQRNKALGELNNVLTAKAADVTRLESLRDELVQARDAAREQTRALGGQLQELQAQVEAQQGKLNSQQSLLDELDQMAEEPNPAALPAAGEADEENLPLRP